MLPSILQNSTLTTHKRCMENNQGMCSVLLALLAGVRIEHLLIIASPGIEPAAEVQIANHVAFQFVSGRLQRQATKDGETQAPSQLHGLTAVLYRIQLSLTV